jgi:hypothetical protein
MRSNVRFSLLALVVGMIVAVVAPAAAQAAFGVETVVATNCKVGYKACGSEEFAGPVLGPPPNPGYVVPKKEVTVPEGEKEGFTQAGGRVPFGVTDFKVKTTGTLPDEKPEGGVANHVRVDVAKGLATAPADVPDCSEEEFGKNEAIPGSGLGFYAEPTCKPETEIGEEKVTLYLGPELEAGLHFGDLPVEGKVYNLPQPTGLASYYGVALKFPVVISKIILESVFKGTNPGVEDAQYFVHSFVKGNVEWGQQENGTGKGDYHDYFEVEISEAFPLISSRQVLYGTSGGTNGKGATGEGNGAFITNGTACPGDHTTFVTLKDKAEEKETKSFETPIPLSGCSAVLFEPSFAVSPLSYPHDEAVGFTAEVGIPQEPEKLASSQLKTATVTLPPGMTLNPSAANGLADCTPAQARINSPVAGMSCPESSEIGTVELEVPTLPPGSLKGKIYLGGPETGKITGSPFTVYLDAESSRYGVSVRLKGETRTNEATGQVTTVFAENPEQPFTTAKLNFNGSNALHPAVVASPLSCGSATASGNFEPVSFEPGSSPLVKAVTTAPFSVTGCSSPIPFAPGQTTSNQTATPAANTSFTFSLTRPSGQQYLSQVQTTLPEGLVGKIPAAEQCSEAAANSETIACPEGSKIGAAVVEAGAGSTPYKFTGQVYLTGPYNGAPFGMSIKVPTEAGPFNFGTQVTRATLNINQYTGRVTVTSVLPTIRRGVPLRIKQIVVAVTKQGFLINPTNCSVLQTESAISGFTPETGATATASLSTPFQVTGCGGLSFKPSFKSKTSAKTSKANGASLETTLNIGAGQTNFKSVLVQLPKQLPSRLTTLQKACPEAVFASNPYHCPSGSFVGGARANTPTLPGKLQGPAILVSHAGLAFPDLDLVMEANGVKVILVGNTKISKGITTTNFASPPDVPVSSITVNLPIGGHSAVTANGSLCINPLTMPTTLTGQNGFVIKQNTKITVTSCGVRIAGKKTVGNTAYITVQTYSAGRISGSGSNLKTVYRKLSKAQKTATLKVPLSNGGARKGKPLKVKLRIGFVPKTKSVGNSASTTTVVFG